MLGGRTRDRERYSQISFQVVLPSKEQKARSNPCKIADAEAAVQQIFVGDC